MNLFIFFIHFRFKSKHCIYLEGVKPVDMNRLPQACPWSSLLRRKPMDKETAQNVNVRIITVCWSSIFFKLSSYLLPEAIRTRHNNKRERDFVAAKTVASKNITRGRRGEGREKLDRYR